MRADHGEKCGLGDEPAFDDPLNAVFHLLEAFDETDQCDCQSPAFLGHESHGLGVGLADIKVGEMRGGFLVGASKAFKIVHEVLFDILHVGLRDFLDLKASEYAVVHC